MNRRRNLVLAGATLAALAALSVGVAVKASHHSGAPKDAAPAADEVNFSDLGIQLTRSFRALKLWMFPMS